MNKLTQQPTFINRLFHYGKRIFLLLIFSIGCREHHPFIFQGQEIQPPKTLNKNNNKFAEPGINLLHRSPSKIVFVPKPLISRDETNTGTPFFTHYGTDEGLPVNSVLCSFTDHDGNIWFGTAGAGVSKYDGNRFTNYNLSHGLASSVVFAINEDENNNLWFGTSAGVSRYDGYGFKNFTIANGMAGNFISSIVRDSTGNLWFGTHEGGISKYDGKRITNFSKKSGLPDNYVLSMLADKNGTLWIGTAGGGISNFDGVHFRNFTTFNGLPDNTINTILQDKKGVIWIGTNKGICSFDSSRFTTFSNGRTLSEKSISCIAEDNAGDLWIGTPPGEIGRFNGKRFRSYGKLQGLSGGSMTGFSTDKAGNIWITSLGGGAFKYEDNNLLKFMIPGISAGETVFSILKDKHHNLWLGTQQGGLIKYDGKCFMNFRPGEGISIDWIWSLLEDRKGNIWFTTDKKGVGKYDGKNLIRYKSEEGLATNSVNSILEDKNGNIWLGTEGGGVSRFDGKSFTNFSTAQGLPGNNVESIVEDNEGNIWFATHDNGISKYNGKEFTNYTTNDGLPANTVYSSLKDKNGNLWFGTNRGASKFDGKNFINYTKEQGMPDNIIWAMGEDKLRGILWFGTNAGLAALTEESSSGNKNEENKIEIFNPSNGYPIKAVNAGALFVEDNGTVWIGIEHNKLLCFDYPSLPQKNSTPVKLKIENIRVNNENICWNYLQDIQKKTKSSDSLTLLNEMIISFGKVLDSASLKTMAKKFGAIRFNGIARFFPVPENLVLPYNFNAITFDFTAIAPSISGQVKYQYLLENYSKDWSPPGITRTANFENIAPGNYTFRVKALVPSGKWSETAYSFRVLSPWWSAWWAYIFYGLLTVGIFYGFYSNHIHRIKRRQAAQIKNMVATQEEERSRIARDLHDEVGIKLSALKLSLSSLSEQLLVQGTREIKNLVVNSERLTGEAMQEIRRLLLNLSPGVLEEFGYITAIEALIHKINETSKMHFSLQVFGIEHPLQKDYELALYRITQELINNAIKHSCADEVSLQIGKRNEKIILMIEDNGKGFDVVSKKEGNGLRNLGTRTLLMKGNITIDSTPGKGTSIIIEIPYNKNSV